MAGSRRPGPLGLNPKVQDLNDGTIIRGLSPRPGLIGAKVASVVNFHGKPSATSFPTRSLSKKSLQIDLQVLRQGSRGLDVQKLQRQLNWRSTPSPKLGVDGIFGPLTNQAVLQYQRGVLIATDGVVGKQTWYHLLKGDKAIVPQTSLPRAQPYASGPSTGPKSATAVSPSNIAARSTQVLSIWEWPLEEKFAEALRRTAPKLPGSMRHEFEALLNPTSLGVIVGTLVIWAGSHAFGIGEAVDVVLLVGGAIFLGMSVFDVAEELGDFLVVTSTAAIDEDLEEAASHLARAIAIMGIVAFIALLAKVARARGVPGSAGKASSGTRSSETLSPRRQQPGKPASEPANLRTSAKATDKPAWNLGGHKSAQKFQNQMQKRGWTPEQIDEAISSGQHFPALNMINSGNAATRYVHPQTGRSVVVDNVTKEVLHVGGDGFKY